MAPILKVALSHSGVVNTIPCAIVYAPLQYQGLGLTDLYVEQGLGKVLRLVKYGHRSKHITSCLLRHSCEALKMELGLNGYLFQHDPENIHDISTPSWVRFVWKFLYNHDICLRDDLPDFALLCENDALTMQAFSSLDLTASERYQVNYCQIYLQVTSLAEITEGNGLRISMDSWQGRKSVNFISTLHWCVQPRPPESFWDIWRTTLSKLCFRDRRLRCPLGRWTSEVDKRALWWFDDAHECLYQKTKTGFVFFTQSGRRNTRNARLRFLISRGSVAILPATALPCSVSIQGAFVLLLGYSSYVPITNPSFQSFRQYVDSLISYTWALGNFQMSGSIEVLVDAIQVGQCICITDGSYKDQHGTAAWKIVDTTRPDHSITGTCVTPGLSSQQCAYRSELSGLYAVVVMTNALIDYFSIDGGIVAVVCDNISALNVIAYDPVGTNPSACPHYDFVMAIQYIKSWRITWSHQHVDGHMDDVQGHVLTPLERLNVEMDGMAKAHWLHTFDLRDED